MRASISTTRRSSRTFQVWVSPDSGLFRGAGAVNRWYANNVAHWSDQRWELIETFEQGPNVAFVLRWSGRGKRSGVELGGHAFGVMSFQEGRTVSIIHLGGKFGEVVLN